ncbi:MAG: hypothetical protein K2K25_00505, partial [Muribaculaceae bacterium]|nr:hypothetical protein [Muribaculaceae bacterium]
PQRQKAPPQIKSQANVIKHAPHAPHQVKSKLRPKQKLLFAEVWRTRSVLPYVHPPSQKPGGL